LERQILPYSGVRNPYIGVKFSRFGVGIAKISGFDPLFLYLIVPYTEEISRGGGVKRPVITEC